MPRIPESDIIAEVLAENLAPPVNSQEYALLQTFKSLHPDSMQHVAVIDRIAYEEFPLVDFLKTHDVDVHVSSKPRQELVSWAPIRDDGSGDIAFPWRASEASKSENGMLVSQLGAGILQFMYKGTDFVVYKISWHPQNHYEYGQRALYDIVFEGTYEDWSKLASAGHRLAADVYQWAGSIKDEIWVFQDGNWAKDKSLYRAINSSSWDNICLENEFVKNIRRDVRTFFESEDVYRGLGIVWKRGILMLGPPGNGKTETIKILLKEFRQTSLYVKSFKTDRMYLGPEYGIRMIFDHARANSPCVVVIEDLDSMVTEDVRSFFLNELDGFGRNEGIMIIASTNHPERIDDSIINRPSRFDVKYTFDYPTEALRKTFALRWLRKINALPPERKSFIDFARTESELAEEIAKTTEGWSFAFLKELFTSFLLNVAYDSSLSHDSSGSDKPMNFSDEILFDKVKVLSKQVQLAKERAVQNQKAAVCPANPASTTTPTANGSAEASKPACTCSNPANGQAPATDAQQGVKVAADKNVEKVTPADTQTASGPPGFFEYLIGLVGVLSE